MNARALRLAWRGIQVDARRPAHHGPRTALVASLFVALCVAAARASLIGAPGLGLFRSVYLIDVFAILGVATSVFATTLTEEKEQQTLGLLRLAGFGRLSVLLGKSAALLVELLVLLLVQVPFVLLAVTLGGVTTAYVLAAFTVLGAFAVFAAALGLCASTVIHSGRGASAVTLLGLLVYSLLPAWGPSLFGTGPLIGLRSWVGSISVWYAPGELAAATGRTADIVLGNLGLAAGLLGLAIALFDRCNADDRPAAPARAVLFTRRDRAEIRGRPITWKDRRFMSGGGAGLALRLLAYGAAISLLAVATGTGRHDTDRLGATVFTTACLLGAVDVCAYGGRMFREEITWGTLPVLLTLPLTAEQIVGQKLAAAVWVLVPAASYALLGALIAPRFVTRGLGEVFASPVGWYLLSLVVLAFVLTMQLSLSVRRGAFLLAIAALIAGHLLLLAVTFRAGPGAMGCVGVAGSFALVGALVSLTSLGPRLRRIGGQL